MKLKSLRNVVIVILLITFFSLSIYNDYFDVNKSTPNSNVVEVITPTVTTSEETLATPLANYNLKEFSKSQDAVAYIMEQAKNFNKKIEFAYIGKVPDFTNDIKTALTYQANSYVYGTITGWKTSTKNDGSNRSEIRIEFSYIDDAKYETIVNQKVKEIAKSLTKSGMSDFDKVFAVNNYVVGRTVYSSKTKTSPHHIYAILNEGKGVCQAYALLTHRLLQEMGVESRYVVGYAGGEDHAWNVVKVNGKWYHLDTTWNDLDDNWPANNVSYEYFLLPSTKMKEDHYWDDKVYATNAVDDKYKEFRNVDMGIVHNNFVYYTNKNNKHFYKLDIKNLKATQLLNKRVYDFAANGNFIYYSDYSNGGYLTSYNITNGQTQILDKSAVKKVTFANGILTYYVNGAKKTYNTAAKPKLASLAASRVAVTNNYNKNDQIVLKGLTKGNVYTIYSDAALKKKITSFTANGASRTVAVKQLGNKAGYIYVVVSKSGYTNSPATKVSFKAERLPALAAKNVAISNKVKSDTITLKGLTKGNTYTIYSDAKLKKKVSAFTAKGASQKVTVKQLGKKAGSVYIVVSKSGYTNSPATKVNYKKETR